MKCTTYRTFEAIYMAATACRYQIFVMLEFRDVIWCPATAITVQSIACDGYHGYREGRIGRGADA